MTLVKELEQAAKDYETLCCDGDTCEGCYGHDQAARLRKRLEHIKKLQGYYAHDNHGSSASAIENLMRSLP